MWRGKKSDLLKHSAPSTTAYATRAARRGPASGCARTRPQSSCRWAQTPLRAPKGPATAARRSPLQRAPSSSHGCCTSSVGAMWALRELRPRCRPGGAQRHLHGVAKGVILEVIGARIASQLERAPDDARASSHEAARIFAAQDSAVVRSKSVLTSFQPLSTRWGSERTAPLHTSKRVYQCVYSIQYT